MQYTFRAYQKTNVTLAGSLEQVQTFLSDPRHLVEALLDLDRVRQVGTGRFAVRMFPIQALNMQISPEVELKIVTDARSCVHLKAVNCRIRGNDWLDRNFHLFFEGYLSPCAKDSGLQDNASAYKGRHSEKELAEIALVGNANLEVGIGMPPLMQLTPKSIVDGIGNPITRGVLTAIERSLCRKLPHKFRSWQQEQTLTAEMAELSSGRIKPVAG